MRQVTNEELRSMETIHAVTFWVGALVIAAVSTGGIVMGMIQGGM